MVEFGWWDRVWYIEPTDSHEQGHIGWWLGPSTMVGSAMSSWILTNKAQEIVHSSIFPLELHNDQVKQKCLDYGEMIKERLPRLDSTDATGERRRSCTNI